MSPQNRILGKVLLKLPLTPISRCWDYGIFFGVFSHPAPHRLPAPSPGPGAPQGPPTATLSMRLGQTSPLPPNTSSPLPKWAATEEFSCRANPPLYTHRDLCNQPLRAIPHLFWYIFNITFVICLRYLSISRWIIFVFSELYVFYVNSCLFREVGCKFNKNQTKNHIKSKIT